MATPDFVLALREKIGHAPLWLSGVTAVVIRGRHSRHEVLLVRRADTGAWTPVTGIIDPGEEPAVAAEREVLEEADIVSQVDVLAWVKVLPPIRYPNGDESQYLDLVFRCGYISGEPYPADGENTAAAWFALDALPDMSAEMMDRIRVAVEANGSTRFER
ncbi:NUDIX domain-containing protein [Lacisediminihabitans sp.]|jgi:8-oxo-dGTP pyrophosphatase MutT (NUDIX family)|uniref:NUDIX hydrolase n=1 Tax=Lacisediminihabitans sp. TaxID=2787631 RepID=UPI002F957132